MGQIKKFTLNLKLLVRPIIAGAISVEYQVMVKFALDNTVRNI